MSGQSTSEGGCDLEYGTRNEIRALMLNAELSPGCKYAITGYSRGCLQTEEIILTASDVDRFEQRVEILYPGKTEYWTGVYSIAVNRVLSLRDDIGNRIFGRYGNEVDRFPWGKPNVHSNTIDNADVYIDCDTTQNINSNSWKARAYTDLRGFNGVFEQNSVDSYGRIYLNAAMMVDFRRNKVQSLAYIYFSGDISDIYIRQNTFSDNSYVRKFNTATGRFTVIDSLLGRGDLRHYNGTMYCNSLDMLSGGRVYGRTQGLFDIRDMTVSDRSIIQTENPNAASRHLLRYGSISSSSSYYVRAAANSNSITCYYRNQDSSVWDLRSSVAANTILDYSTKQDSQGYIRMDNLQAGRVYFNANKLSSRAQILLNNVTALNFSYNTLLSYTAGLVFTNVSGNVKNINYNTLMSGGRVLIDDFASNRLNMYYNVLSSGAQIDLNNCTGLLTINNNDMSSNAILRMDEVSAISNISVNNIRSRGEVRFQRNTGTLNFYYNSVMDYLSQVYINLTSQSTHYGNSFRSRSRYEATGGLVNGYYGELHSQAQVQRTKNTGGYWGYCDIGSVARLNMENSTVTYGLRMGANATVNTFGNSITRCSVFGSGTVNLTANNNNRGKFHTLLNNLI